MVTPTPDRDAAVGEAGDQGDHRDRQPAHHRRRRAAGEGDAGGDHHLRSDPGGEQRVLGALHRGDPAVGDAEEGARDEERAPGSTSRAKVRRRRGQRRAPPRERRRTGTSRRSMSSMRSRSTPSRINREDSIVSRRHLLGRRRPGPAWIDNRPLRRARISRRQPFDRRSAAAKDAAKQLIGRLDHERAIVGQGMSNGCRRAEPFAPVSRATSAAAKCGPTTATIHSPFIGSSAARAAPRTAAPGAFGIPGPSAQTRAASSAIFS